MNGSDERLGPGEDTWEDRLGPDDEEWFRTRAERWFARHGKLVGALAVLVVLGPVVAMLAPGHGPTCGRGWRRRTAVRW